MIEVNAVNESSFLSQLEQRTEQVKITLANLEAERVRIEGLIGRLQPLVPHYDALIDAERSLQEANVQLESSPGPTSATPADEQAAPSWQQQHQPSWEEQHQPQEAAPGEQSQGWQG
jgi:hypothetical protein